MNGPEVRPASDVRSATTEARTGLMNDFKVYKNVLVSGKSHDFEGRSYREVPRALLVDWVSLVVQLAQLLHPEFHARSLTATDQFQTETIDSDGPYGSSENYYTLSYVFMDLTSSDGVGVRILFEDGRQEGGEPLGIETQGIHPQISSYIDKGTRGPLARIHIVHDDEATASVEKLISLHSAKFRAAR
jgi:hypothetical protein